MSPFCLPQERSPARDAALAAALAHVPVLGWGWPALAAGLRAGGMAADAARLEAELLYPGGAADMVAAFIDRADREMGATAAAPGFAQLRTTAKVRTLVLERLARWEEHRAAVRRAAGVLALPRHACLAASTLARTVDTIWCLAGDTSDDINRYTKRALLAGVYAATLLYWMREGDEAAVAAFLDRRLQGVGRIGKLRARVESGLTELRDRFRPAA